MRHPGWLFSMHLFVGVIMESWARSLAISHQHNLWLYNWSGAAEFTLQLGFAWACTNSKPLRQLCVLLGLSYLVVFLRERHYLSDPDAYMDHSALAGAAFLALTYTCLLFIMAEDQERALLARPEFPLFFSGLLYNGGMLPLSGLLSTLNGRDPRLADRLLTINDVLFFASLAVFCLACWRFRTTGPTLWRTRT